MGCALSGRGCRDPRWPPRALLIAAIVVAVAAIIGMLMFAASGSLRRTTTVPIASVPAPKADSAECRALPDALPDGFGTIDARRRPSPRRRSGGLDGRR